MTKRASSHFFGRPLELIPTEDTPIPKQQSLKKATLLNTAVFYFTLAMMIPSTGFSAEEPQPQKPASKAIGYEDIFNCMVFLRATKPEIEIVNGKPYEVFLREQGSQTYIPKQKQSLGSGLFGISCYPGTCSLDVTWELAAFVAVAGGNRHHTLPEVALKEKSHFTTGSFPPSRSSPALP